VIFTSLIDGAQNFYHQGELLHQCARKIATVHHELKNIDVSSDREKAKEQLEKLQKEYQKALDDCPVNHENVDFYREIANKPHLFDTHYPWKWKFPFIIWYKYTSIILSHIWMFMHIIAILAISAVVYIYVLHGAEFITR
jgi:hypothetical protein